MSRKPSMTEEHSLHINFTLALKNGGTVIRAKFVDTDNHGHSFKIELDQIIRPELAPSEISNKICHELGKKHDFVTMRGIRVVGGHVSTTQENRLEGSYQLG